MSSDGHDESIEEDTLLPDDGVIYEVVDDDDENDAREDRARAAAMVVTFLAVSAAIAHAIRTERRQPRRLYLTRADLLENPRIGTPWQQLYGSRSDRAFITTMGFDVPGFHRILSAGFEQGWNSRPIERNDVDSGGAPRLGGRSLDAAGALGLVLHWLNSTMREVSLQQIFALTPTVLNRYLGFARQLLIEVLRSMPEARIRWPKGEEFGQLNNLCLARHPLLVGAFGSVDGLNLPLQTSDDPTMENNTYNGWLHGHFCSSVIAFSVAGLIIACTLNAPGSWHDAAIARHIYNLLLDKTPDGYYLVADTAFPRREASIASKIKCSIKKGERLPEEYTERAELQAFSWELLAYRQTAEWGMHGIQGSFGRLRIPLPVKDSKARRELLETCFRLHNARVRMIGIGHIHSVYEPLWRNEDDELWLNFGDMLFSEVRHRDRVSGFHKVRDDV